jgi:hypothetical protein
VTITRLDDDATFSAAAALSAGDHRAPLASVEPGAVLQPSPPRSGGSMSSHPLDGSFALAEPIDATEADTNLSVGVQLQQACPDGLVSAAPAAWFRWLDQVATDGSHGHDPSLERRDRSNRRPTDTDAATHPKRDLRPPLHSQGTRYRRFGISSERGSSPSPRPSLNP